MKKILSIILASSFIACSAFANGVIGVKVGVGDLSGERTKDPSHGVATASSASEDSEFAAAFAEFAVSDMVSLGIEVIPMEAKIDTKGTTAADSTATISDYTTIYALVPIMDSQVYGKIGYSRADLSVKANYIQTTVQSSSDKLEGPMIGIGVQLDSPIGFLDVIRIEGTYTDFDKLSITTKDTNEAAITKEGEAELMTLSLSVGKSF